MTLITLATTPKPFVNPHIATIQLNAIQSWLHLGDEVDVVMVGAEPGAEEVSSRLGVPLIKDVARNESGTPLVSSIFEHMRQLNANPILVYVNADILLLPDFVKAIRQSFDQKKEFLGVGQRWDLDITSPLVFDPRWDEQLVGTVREKGNLHAPVGSDYFVFPRSLFQKIPDFAIGRAGWDNWMIYEARRRGWPVIDFTSSVMIIHQNHDYSHLPGGQPHYRLPETFENIRRGGGRRMIFNLVDADHQLENGIVQTKKLSWKKMLREVEVFPLVRLQSKLLGELFFVIFHPISAFKEWRGRLLYKLKNSMKRK